MTTKLRGDSVHLTPAERRELREEAKRSAARILAQCGLTRADVLRIRLEVEGIA